MLQDKVSIGRGISFRKIEPYFYLAPATILIVLIFLYPILDILRTSLLQNNPNGIKTFGYTNYRLVFQDPVFWQALGNNGKLLLSVPILTILSLLIAILLFEHVRGWSVYRGIIFMPYVLAVPVVGLTFVYLLGLNGIVNTMLKGAGLGFLAQDWLGSIHWVLPSLSVVIIYREMGFGVVLFLARMMSLEKEILEAAEIDGATFWQKHIFVTLPQMSGVIEFFIVVELITMLSWVFAYVFTMTGGGPGFASTVMEFYIWKHAFAFRSPGIASALAVVLLAVTTVLIVLQLRLRRRSLEEGA
jgi:ABC-type sugar transport system permease subunit